MIGMDGWWERIKGIHDGMLWWWFDKYPKPHLDITEIISFILLCNYIKKQENLIYKIEADPYSNLCSEVRV